MTVLNDVPKELGEFAATESLCRELLQHARDKVPPNISGITYGLAELTCAFLDGRKFSEAEPFARECLDIRERTIRTIGGPSTPGAFWAQASSARRNMPRLKHGCWMPIRT